MENDGGMDKMEEGGARWRRVEARQAWKDKDTPYVGSCEFETRQMLKLSELAEMVGHKPVASAQAQHFKALVSTSN
jgi:hypothetical protein